VFTPSQVPPQLVPAPLHAGWPVRGSPVTALQVPFFPLSLQASQGPLHAELQHTPSTQLPDRHIDAEPHAAPLATFAAQVVPLQ
jgi:hypothetical protein